MTMAKEVILHGGLIIDSVDGLIDAYEALQAQKNEIQMSLIKIREALLERTTGEAKTRYVRGETREVKVTMPSRCWSQEILKEAWNAWPQHQEDLIRIERLGVKLRTFDKAVRTTGPKDWEAYRDMVVSAEVPSYYSPTVSITK